MTKTIDSFIPSKDKVLILHDAPDVTRGGIHIPDNVSQRPQGAVVIAAGPACRHVKKGSRVLASQFDGTLVEIDDVKYKILREEQLLAVYT